MQLKFNKMKMTFETKNDLFNRRELIIEVDSDTNIGFDEAKKRISEKFGVSEETVQVNNIYGSFGKHQFIIKADIYDSKEDLDKMKKLKTTRKERKESLKEKKENSESKSE